MRTSSDQELLAPVAQRRVALHLVDAAAGCTAAPIFAPVAPRAVVGTHPEPALVGDGPPGPPIPLDPHRTPFTWSRVGQHGTQIGRVVVMLVMFPESQIKIHQSGIFIQHEVSNHFTLSEDDEIIQDTTSQMHLLPTIPHNFFRLY